MLKNRTSFVSSFSKRPAANLCSRSELPESGESRSIGAGLRLLDPAFLERSRSEVSRSMNWFLTSIGRHFSILGNYVGDSRPFSMIQKGALRLGSCLKAGRNY